MTSTSIGGAIQLRNEYKVPNTMKAWVLGGPPCCTDRPVGVGSWAV